MWELKGKYALSGMLERLGRRNFTSTKAAGDMRDAAAREAFLKEMGIPADKLVTMEQVHGAVIREVNARDGGRPACPQDSENAIIRSGGEIAGADGIVSSGTCGLWLGIFTADCVPLLGVSSTTGSSGAFHAGWRGIDSGIVEGAVAALGGDPSSMFFALGPGICPDCYKVGTEFKDKFKDGYSGGSMGLGREIISRLERLGVPEKNIDAAGEEFCTSHNEELFYSYRRARGPNNKNRPHYGTERMVTVIAAA